MNLLETDRLEECIGRIEYMTGNLLHTDALHACFRQYTPDLLVVVQSYSCCKNILKKGGMQAAHRPFLIVTEELSQNDLALSLGNLAFLEQPTSTEDHLFIADLSCLGNLSY